MKRGFQTEKNLKEAFAGESMANRKYLYFAKQAHRLGNNEVATLFENIANQETAHAFLHLELIYPPETLNVAKLLELAIEGETYETNEMYPTFAKVAYEDGQLKAKAEFDEQATESLEHAKIFQKAAQRFNMLKGVEKLRADKYQAALDKLNGRMH